MRIQRQARWYSRGVPRYVCASDSAYEHRAVHHTALALLRTGAQPCSRSKSEPGQAPQCSDQPPAGGEAWIGRWRRQHHESSYYPLSWFPCDAWCLSCCLQLNRLPEKPGKPRSTPPWPLERCNPPRSSASCRNEAGSSLYSASLHCCIKAKTPEFPPGS